MIKVGIVLSGRFRLYTTNKKGEIKRDSGWFKNLITDNGLDLCATSTGSWGGGSGMCNFVAVGSGNNTPSASDVQLQSLIASTSSGTSGIGIDSANRFFYFQKTWQFPQGVAAGNISEVGVGYSGTDLFSRALIVDGMGTPTSITVLPDEFLNISYELRVNQPTTDFVETVDGYSVTIRSAQVDSTSGIQWTPSQFTFDRSNTRVGTGPIQPITSLPGGALVNSSSIDEDSYVSGSFERSANLIWSPSVANQSNQSLLFFCGPAVWQAGFSPTIDKVSTQELKIGVKMTWAREGELPS